MGLQRERIVTPLKKPELYYFRQICLRFFGEKQFLQSLISSIGCLLGSWVSRVLWMSFPHFIQPSPLLITLFLTFLGVSFVHVHSPNRGKLDPRALKCICAGYSLTQKGYKCYQPSSKRFYVSMDVTFNEHYIVFLPSFSSGGEFN